MTARGWIISWSAAAALLLGGFAMGQDAPIPKARPADRMPDVTAPLTELPLIEPDAGTVAAPNASPAENALAAPAQTASEAAAVMAVELQNVHLTARITEEGETIPEGLVWRVFDTKVDPSGELALTAKSEDAAADLRLPPGTYVVHVAYGRAQASDTITVESGSNTKALILDAGALRLNAAITGDVAIPLPLLRFDVFSTASESDQTLVAQNLTANEIVTLNAGTYHVVSHFGDINAVVRANLQVEPGKMTEATLYHHAAQVSFKLVTEAGGEAIADVEWTVKSADGATLFSEIGAFPVTVLAEGDYVVLAKRGTDVFNRDFQVQPGPAREVEVLTAVY